MKNWIDRVLSMGFAYGHSEFGTKLRPRKGLLMYTTGGPKAFLGAYEPSIWQVLNEGVFGFCGITALEPYIAYAPAHETKEGREKMLEDLKKMLTNLDKRELYKPLAAKK